MTLNVNAALDLIANATYGKEVREAIVDAIMATYTDATMAGNANMEVIMARGIHANLSERLSSLTNNDFDISSDAKKIKIKNLSNEVLQAMAGNTPINVVPADNSVTTEKIADGALTPAKMPDNSIKYDQIKNPVTMILHPNTLIVDFKAMVVQTDRPDGLWVITEDDARAVHNNVMQTIDISQLPGMINPNDHTVYRIYLDREDNNMLKLLPVRDKTPKNYTLGFIYKQNVYGNPQGIKWIGSDGLPRSRYNFEQGTINESYQRNATRHILGKNVLEIDFLNKRVVQKGTVHILMDNNFTTVTVPADPIIPFPSDYIHGGQTYKLYYDRKEAKFKVVNNYTDTAGEPIICRMYYTFIACESYHSVYGIGTTGKRFNMIDPVPIETEGVSKPFVDILHAESIEINYQTKKVKVTNYNGLYIWKTQGYVTYNPLGTEFDFSHLPLTDVTQHGAYYLFIDINDGYKLKIDKSLDIPVESYVLAKIYQTSVQGNERGIKVIDKDGNKINRVYGQAPISPGMDMMYNYYKDAIDIIASEKKIRWKATTNAYLSTANGPAHLTVPEGQEYGELDYSNQPDPTSYVRILYYDFDEKALKVKSFSGALPSKRVGLICFFSYTGANAKIIAPFNGEQYIKVDGMTYADRNKTGLDWMNNKFMIPNDLYLLKDVPYSINAQSFNYQELNESDNAKFELITPTQVLTFEDSATFNSPIEVDLMTRIVGAIDGKRENSLFRNITMHFADRTKVTKKEPKVLMIGDSITNASIPPYVAYWLRQFGLNPTMIGTLSNNYTGYGFGFNPPPKAENGEGRGGWRLTDFVGTTKRKDGSTFISASPFLNPSAGYGFDFGYYMTKNNFSGVDFVIIMLGTNDLTGYHYKKEAENIGTPTQAEILAYMPDEYKKMITSIKAYNPNVVIGLVPPPLAGYANSNGVNTKFKDFTEVMHNNFDGKISNVYCLANYLANGPVSGKTSVDNEPVQINSNNPTMRGTVSNNVHDIVTNTSLNALWSASFIVNRSI